MMKPLRVLLICCFVIGLACKKESNQATTEGQYDMMAVAGPTTARVGEQLTLTISYPYSNGCHIIQNFKQEKSGTLLIIRAFGTSTENLICTQDAGIRTKDYLFSSATPGVFELRFTNRSGTFTAHTVTVN